MRKPKVHLSKTDRQLIDEIRSSGNRNAREVNRAHILSSLDQGLAEAQILAVLGVSRATVWRVGATYANCGLELALYDTPRSGRPNVYSDDIQTAVIELASSPPPEESARWTIKLLQEAVCHEMGIDTISRETIRRMLKKARDPHPEGP